jgi:peptidoglycan/xylan/chitin deacetylase (PgdA/CDA1 family)
MGLKLPVGAHTHCREMGTISLTIDDGLTKKALNILDILRGKNIKATFFVIGNTLLNQDTFIVLKKIYEDGHTIGNHSWSHPYLTRLSKSKFFYEILTTQNGISNGTDPKNKLYVRPPFGDIDQNTFDALTSLGYSVVFWNLDIRDWDSRKSKERLWTSYLRVLEQADPTKDSFILLLHEKENTLDILPKIIDLAEAKKFRFVSMDECI